MKPTFKQTALSAVAATLLFTSVPNTAFAGIDPYIGEINYVAFNYAPVNWELCNGQVLTVNAYPALYSLLGIQYGGEGNVTFKLPDMRGRFPVHQGRNPITGNYFAMGQFGGNTTAILTVSNLAAHTHAATASSTIVAGTVTSKLYGKNATGSVNKIAGNTLAKGTQMYSTDAPDTEMNAGSVQTSLSGLGIETGVAVGNTGSGTPFSIMPPYLTVNCIIALDGTYPQRP